jgi:hypothetical protein
MEILVKTNFITPEQFSSLHSDCEELKKLFVSITNTTKKKLESYSTREDSQPFIDMDTLID